MSKYKSVPPLLGAGHPIFFLYGGLHLYFGSSQEEAQSCEFAE